MVANTDMSTTNAVIERQQKLIQEFSSLPNWEDRYKLLIEKGKRLGTFPAELQTEALKVKGCQSQVWLHASLEPNGQIKFQGDSDALIVKGLVAVLIETYSPALPAEVLAAPTSFLKDLGFEGHLSPSRANGLYAMLKQILYYAQAFQALAALKPK